MEPAEPAPLVNGDTLSPRNSGQPLATTIGADVSSNADQTAASPVTQDSTPPPPHAHAHVIPPYFDGVRVRRTDSATPTPGQGGIDLVDQSDEDHEIGRACWAKNVSIDDYVVVSGPTGIGAYVVWHCTIETFKGGDITLRKRFVKYLMVKIS